MVGDPPAVGATALASLALRRSERPDFEALAEEAKTFLADAGGGGAAGPPRPLVPRELALALEALDTGDPAFWRAARQQLEARDGEVAGGGAADPAAGLVALRILHRAEAPPDDPGLRSALAALRGLYPDGGGGPVAEDFHYLLVHALDASGRETFTDAAGAERPWRRELARALLDRQQPDGTWPDEGGDRAATGRAAATAYAILALERLLGG